MVDIEKAKIAFKDFLNEYEDKSDLGFELKIVHTYHVAENAKEIAKKLNLSKEDIELAELIGILHDIGRFEELKITKELNSVKFDHAGHGSKMLFEKGMIREFIEDSQYDNIIKNVEGRTGINGICIFRSSSVHILHSSSFSNNHCDFRSGRA